MSMLSTLLGISVLTLLALGWQLANARRRLRDQREQHLVDLAERERLIRTQAVDRERERIYSDLHDDLGASLLRLIYTSPTREHADSARAILQDLRDVVTRSRGTPGTLLDVLGDIQGEVRQRLSAALIGITWEQAENLPDPPLDNEHALHLHRIVREAISNVIRHAQAHHLRIRVREQGHRLGIELTDDGLGIDASEREGSGLRNMRARADEIEADIAWRQGTLGGTKVLLEMPLQRSTS